MNTLLKYCSSLIGLPLVLTGAIAQCAVLCCAPATAQITPDNTLGTQVNGSATAPCTGTCTISNGTVRGGNLFHSLQQFSLPNGDVANFQLTPGIQNVLVRVTGVGQPFISNLNGTIQTSAPANFFLLNPNGITFGPGATLDIGGSFLATTATSMQFADGSQFSTTEPEALLTLSLPLGLQFGNSPGAIELQGVVFAAGSSDRFSDFALVGGDVTLNLSQVRSPGRQLSISSVGANGIAQLQISPAGLGTSLAPGVPRRDITLTNQSILRNFSSGGATGISLAGRDIWLDDSLVLAGIGPGVNNSATNRAGDIVLNASGNLRLTQASQLFNLITVNATGQGGNIDINAENLAVSDASTIAATTSGQGNAGKISFQIQNSALLTGLSTVFNSITQSGQGSTGGITLTAQSLTLLEGAEFVGETQGIGSTAAINVAVKGSIRLDGQDQDGNPSGLLNSVKPNGLGNSGDINVKAESLIITNGARLQTNTNGQGNAGNINVEMRDVLYMDSVNTRDRNNFTGIFAAVDLDGQGNGGNINVTAASATLLNGAQLLTGTFGVGNAGNIRVIVRDQARLDGFSINSESAITSTVGGRTRATAAPAWGNGGQIEIESTDLTVTNGAGFATNVTPGSRGNAGGITVRTRNIALFSGRGGEDGNPSGIFTQVEKDAIGNANNIDIIANTLVLQDRAQFSAVIEGQGTAGNIKVQAANFDMSQGSQLRVNTSGPASAGDIVLQIQDQATISGTDSGLFSSTQVGSTGTGGNILINAKVLTTQDRAQISVGSQGIGSGGTLRIQADRLTLDTMGQLLAETTSSQGGNIFLTLGDRLLMRRGSTISTSAGLAGAGGNGGNITINAPQGFLVTAPNENNDITANAFNGSGGRVTINAQGIYHFTPRSRADLVQRLGTTDPALLDPSRLPSNDITAISQGNPDLSGRVILNLLNVDPSRGLVALPVDLVDPSQLIAQTCRSTGKQAQGSFVLVGQGGMPTSPLAMLAGETLILRLAETAGSLGAETREHTAPVVAALPVASPVASPVAFPGALLQANGWISAPDGSTQLVALVPADAVVPGLPPCPPEARR